MPTTETLKRIAEIRERKPDLLGKITYGRSGSGTQSTWYIGFTVDERDWFCVQLEAAQKREQQYRAVVGPSLDAKGFEGFLKVGERLIEYEQQLTAARQLLERWMRGPGTSISNTARDTRQFLGLRSPEGDAT